MLKYLLFFFSVSLMAQTPVLPLKISPDGLPQQFNISSDYVGAKGGCYNSACTIKIEADGSGNLGFKDLTDSFLRFDEVAAAAFAARYTITFEHNGTVGNGTFYGYSNLLPGDSTPVLAPVNSTLKGFSFSNSSALADYNLEFRKNSTVATPFATVSKTNTQFFSQTLTDQTFNAGDRIYIKHIKTGDNTSDVGIVLFFQVVP